MFSLAISLHTLIFYSLLFQLKTVSQYKMIANLNLLRSGHNRLPFNQDPAEIFCALLYSTCAVKFIMFQIKLYLWKEVGDTKVLAQ